MDLKEIFSKALEISQETKFLVRVYENSDIVKQSEMTYFELGSKLVSEVNRIKRIDIYLKDD